MESLAKANLLAGVGLEGDRYAQKVGTYSVFRSSKLNAGEQEPGRQLTLISADGAEAVLSKAGISIDDLGSLRRNIVLRGVPEGELLKWVGKTVRIGIWMFHRGGEFLVYPQVQLTSLDEEQKTERSGTQHVCC